MIKLKVNGKPVYVKTSWDELTYEEYYKIFNLKDGVTGMISILSGIDCEILKKAQINGLESLIPILDVFTVPPKWEAVTLQCGKYTLPINSSTGQFNIQ